MHNVVLSPIDTEKLINRIAEKTVELISKQKFSNSRTKTQDDPLKNFVEKSEAMDILGVSSATLYRWEQKGKIQSYGIGTKRYYKRTELESAITAIKK